MDEETLQASLEEYQSQVCSLNTAFLKQIVPQTLTCKMFIFKYIKQVAQMDAAIAVTTDENTIEELSKLRDEMQQLVQLTEGFWNY